MMFMSSEGISSTARFLTELTTISRRFNMSCLNMLKNICFNLRLSSTKWHCQTPSTVLDIFDFMKKDLWTFNIDCQNFYGSLFVGFHCISGWAKLFTVRTNEPWRRHMFRFNMILASSSILGNIIAFRTTIQSILPSNHHRLNLSSRAAKYNTDLLITKC